MTFPGAGRAVWIGGSSGGGSGRTTDWSTYDGTNDTAWQQWVDDTSTALGTTYQVSYTENNAIRAGSLTGYLAITNGSQEFLGYFTADTADATSMSINLSSGHAMTRPEIKSWGSNILMTSTADQGSIVLFKDAGQTSSGKISGLLSFQPTETRHSVVAEYWEMPGMDNTEFGTAGKAYSLILVAKNPNQETISYTTGSATGTNQPVWIHAVLEDLDTLYSTPSSALTGLDAITSTISGQTNEAAYLPLHSYSSVGGDPDSTGSFYNGVEADGTAHSSAAESLPRLMWTGDSNFKWMQHPTGGRPGNGVEFRGAMLNWTPYHATDGSTTGGNQAGVMWNITFTNHRWNLRHPTNTADNFWLDRPASGNQNAEWNDISVQNPDRIQYQGGQLRSETQLGEDLVQTIRLESGQWVGMYGDSNGTKGGNLYVNSVARTSEDLDANWTYRTSPEYIVAEDISTPDTHASNSLAVSVTNGSDSTSTAFDPDSATLFTLSANFFAVMWRKSTTAYVSIFSAQTQTSTPVSLTREIDTINLGTVPAGTMSGLRLGTGVAMITCGNYYRIIKTDAI